MIRKTLAINFCVKTPVCIETKSGIFGCASLMLKELAKFSHEINHIRLSLDSTGEMRIELLNNGFSHSAVQIPIRLLFLRRWRYGTESVLLRRSTAPTIGLSENLLALVMKVQQALPRPQFLPQHCDGIFPNFPSKVFC
jgi:hypothetical protein